MMNYSVYFWKEVWLESEDDTESFYEDLQHYQYHIRMSKSSWEILTLKLETMYINIKFAENNCSGECNT